MHAKVHLWRTSGAVAMRRTSLGEKHAMWDTVIVDPKPHRAMAPLDAS